jgi:hypothetical protein
MRKLGFMFLLIALMAGVSVQAQKDTGGIKPAPPIRQPQTITIQDDRNEGYMVFDLVTGAYKCYLCEYQYGFSGTGSVKLAGGLATFSAVEKGYTISAYVNLYDQTATCFIEVREIPVVGFNNIDPMQEILSDSNLRDSTANCITKAPPPPPVVMPSEIILQNDVDGSFLLMVPATGEFKFIHCEDGGAMSGVGKVTREGSSLSFEAFGAEYRVLVSVNLEEKSGKAVIDVFASMDGMKPMQEIISDNNLSDNVPVCGAKK